MKEVSAGALVRWCGEDWPRMERRLARAAQITTASTASIDARGAENIGALIAGGYTPPPVWGPLQGSRNRTSTPTTLTQYVEDLACVCDLLTRPACTGLISYKRLSPRT